MEKYKKSAIKLIKTPTFIVPLIIVAIAGFGYLLTHTTVNVDVLSGNRYIDGTELIAQQRLLAPIIDKIFNIMDFYPFLVDFIAVLFLMVATILFCSLFDVVSKSKIKTISYTIFSCLFISYPLMMEIFPYTPAGLSISIGFCLTALSLIVFYEFLNCKQKKLAILSGIYLWGAISLYESFATVYIMGVLAIILIKILFVNDKKVKLRKHILEGIWYIINLAVVIMINGAITSLILNILHIPISTNPFKEISYKTEGIIGGIDKLIDNTIINFLINALGYLPITILVISSIISIIMSIVLSIRKRDVSIFVVMLGMNITILSLSIIQGDSAAYRTCQQFQLFVGIIFMILSQLVLSLNLKKCLKNIFVFMAFFVIFYQVKEMYYLQYINNLRYQYEKAAVISIANEITSKYNYKEKPVVFCGIYKLPDSISKYTRIKPNSLHYKVLDYYNKNFYDNQIENIETYKVTQSSVQSYIEWALSGFLNEGIPNIELIKYFNLLGYDFKAGTMEMFFESFYVSAKDDVPEWPKDGSIFETEEYIVVHF